MTTAGLDPNLANNIQLLQKQSLKVEFHLDHTDYKKVENIGTGAYGVVCSAINKRTKQKVAIKKIPNIFSMDPRYAIRTYREIKILQHFKHENVIAIREILQPQKSDITDIYVVMDLMESDLHRIIYSKQTLTDEHVKYFLYQILKGLKYVHSAHVIHRDLKPSNLLVNANCELKIGDFGMARGINFKAEKSNQQMTQYVATRWYRAPELIVASRQGYSAAIDMWSVGCIFAEMLRRKHLFPGRDLLNQLAIIFGTLGVPSKEYMESLDSETVCGFIRKVTESNEVKRKSYNELCPKASAEAIDLLSRMLIIEPEKRITVEQALTHSFLAKYHDISYEPRCKNIFDFQFEQELVNLQTDEQKRIKIQSLLRKEILSYQKPAIVDFGSLIQSKPAANSNTTNDKKDDPYADLNAFLTQLASPAKEKVQTNSEVPEKPKGDKMLVATSSTNPLLASVSQNPLLSKQANTVATKKANSIDVAKTSQYKENKVSNTLLQPSYKPTLGSQTNLLPQITRSNSLLAGVMKSTSLLNNNVQSTLISDSFNKPQEQTGANNFNKSVGSASESDHSNDTELFKQLTSKNTTDLKGNNLSVDTINKSSDDVEMLSAKLEQTEIDENKNKDNEDLTVNTSVKSTIEDIEMISAKLVQADISKDLGNSDMTKMMDTKSLLRQRIMQSQINKQVTGKMKGQEEKRTGKAPITAYQRHKERKEIKKQKQLKAQQKKKKAKEPEVTGQLLTSEDQRMLERWRKMARPQPIQPKLPAAQASTSTHVLTTAGNSVIVVYPNTAHSTLKTAVTTTQAVTLEQASIGNPESSQLCHPQTLVTQHLNNIEQCAARNINPSAMHSQSMNNVSQTATTNPQASQSRTNVPGVVNGAQTSQQHTRTFSDLTLMTNNDLLEDTSFYDVTSYDSRNQIFSSQSQTQISNTPASISQNAPVQDWLTNVSVNTTLDLNSFVKNKTSHTDSLPPMFVSTPKGTGGGYGVGFDMESMIPYSPDMQMVQMDSAPPLSASLLADWMDVTGSMDPQFLDDINQELSSALDDFPFGNY